MIVVFVLFLYVSFCSSMNSDFTALLSFKSTLSPPSSQALSSWDPNSTADACRWLGVTCHPTSRRVTRLVLENLNLTGSLDPLSQLGQLRLLSLNRNNLSLSTVAFNFSSWSDIKHLYLSRNRLAGVFPNGISSLRRLRRLDLSHNSFSGEAPLAQLAGLPHLLTVRLEGNSFTGRIDSVGLLPSVLEFNVSGNLLSGQIPAWMSRFPASSFAGNDGLCGDPLPECSNRTARSDPEESGGGGGGGVGRSRNRAVFWIVFVDVGAVAAALVTVTWCVCYCKRRRRGAKSGVPGEVIKGRNKTGGAHAEMGGFYGAGGPREDGDVMVAFEGCRKGFANVDDLLRSSAELLGKGCVGTTYKVVVMDGGDAAVVKRVRERRNKRREVDGRLRVIGGLRHDNIVGLRAYYNSRDELLLVYDYLPNGSLHSLLHGNRGPGRTPLEWNTRLVLASGAAQGLAFLHGYNNAKLFHGNLSSSNILVDQLGNARISEIGLRQILQTPSFSNDAYLAPELVPNTSNNNVSPRKFTQKCDVYSFGVILLEMLTGKTPSGEGEANLVKWVQRVGRDEWTWEVFDFELLRSKETEEEMAALMQVALHCLAPMPRDRPKMSMVHRMIEDIRRRCGREGSPNSIMNDVSSDSSPSLSERANNDLNCAN